MKKCFFHTSDIKINQNKKAGHNGFDSGKSGNSHLVKINSLFLGETSSICKFSFNIQTRAKQCIQMEKPGKYGLYGLPANLEIPPQP